MTDRLEFETRLEERILERAALASRSFDAAAIAREAIAVNGRSRQRGGRLGWPSTRLALRWSLVVLAVVATLLAAVAGIGAFLRERSPLPRPAVSNGWIAFSSQAGWPEVGHDYMGSGGDVYLVREGVLPKIIVSRGARNTSNVCPAFSPDGLTLAYGHRDGSSRAVVFLRVSADGSASETARLDVPGDGNVPCPRWSSDGTRIAYLVDDSRLFVEDPPHRFATIVVRGLDGSTLVPRAGDPSADDLKRTGFALDTVPLLSPSGNRMVLADGRGVVVERPDGSEARVLMSRERFAEILGYAPGTTLEPYAIAAWSPDSRQVVVMGDVSGYDFTMLAISVESPFGAVVLAPFVRVNSASGSSFPGRVDVSWQPVFP
jgi:hypothetical protein